MRRREFITLSAARRCVAARGARAAAGDAGGSDFFTALRLPRPGTVCIRIPQGPEGSRLRRGPERRDRVSLGRGSDTIGCRRWRPSWSRRKVARDRRRTGHAAHGAKAATTTIPIVFASGSDPVGSSARRQPRRPGGNVTGVNFFDHRAGGQSGWKLLRELVPRAHRDRRCWSIRSLQTLRGIAATCRKRRATLGRQIHEQ